MADDTDPLFPPLEPEPVPLTDAEKEAAAEAETKAAEKKKADDEAQAAADDLAAKRKAANIVLIVGGRAANGIANSTGDDGVVIPRSGPVTFALVETLNPSGGNHPGTDINCVARLPDDSEIGDLVEVYCVPGLNGSSAFVHPGKDEAIGTLPVSTGDNVGTGVEVKANAGRSFRKVSDTSWEV